MEKIRKYYSFNLQIVILIISFLITSCSVPKIVIYDDPLTATEHNDLGVVYEKKGMLELAEKEYLKAIKKDKNWYLPYFNLGNLYYKTKDIGKSVEYYKKALKLSENPDVLNNLAYALYTNGEYTEALSYIERALHIEKKPEYFDTYNKIKEKIGN